MSRIRLVNNWLRATAWVYGLYALFLLIEVLDFLSMLHSKPPGFSPTYDIVNVAYYVVDMVVCISLLFAFLLMRFTDKKKYGSIVFFCLLLASFRWVAVYYLYIFTTPEYRWVPYIYKVANAFSNAARILFLPLQVLFGYISAGVGWWAWAKLKKGTTASTTGL